MLITELGFITTFLIGCSFGFACFAILIFWIQLFCKSFDAESKFFWPLFWIHQAIWVVGTCVVPADLLNDSFDKWAWPFMIYFFGSLLVMAFVKFLK